MVCLLLAIPCWTLGDRVDCFLEARLSLSRLVLQVRGWAAQERFTLEAKQCWTSVPYTSWTAFPHCG